MSETIKILDLLPIPAFLASERAELLYLNEAMRRLTGQHEAQPRDRTLIGLGLFLSDAEFRGFVKGFSKVGPVQRLQLPGSRLRDPEKRIMLTATFLESKKLVLGIIDITPTINPLSAPRGESEDEISNHLPYFVLRTDGAGNIVSANEAFRIAFRYPESSAAPDYGSLSGLDVNFTPARWESHLKVARLDGEITYDTQLVQEGGARLPVRVTVSGVRGFPARNAVVSILDLTRFRALRLPDEPEETANRRSVERNRGIADIVSVSPRYREVISKIEKVAKTDSTVLISGETGTGKELVARALHYHSDRREQPFITVNCGALPLDLIESELFGYRKGAFTGANQHRTGLFETADGGTLFLDEIGEWPLSAQTKLLRVLQEKEYTPVGSSTVRFTNVRVLAATNQDLSQMVKAGRFRADLYFRLNIFPINNPPLRDRPEDIVHLANHFIDKHAPRINSRVSEISDAAVALLRQYSFPGNVRELENIIERGLILATGTTLEINPEALQSHGENPPTDGLPENKEAAIPLVDMEKRYIERILELCGGKVSGPGGAAEVLGLNPQTLYSKLRKLDISRK